MPLLPVKAWKSKNRRHRPGFDGVQSDIADTQAGRDILEQSKDVEILGRPILDYEQVRNGSGGRDYQGKKSTSFGGSYLGPSDSNKGWDPVKFTVEGEERRNVLT